MVKAIVARTKLMLLRSCRQVRQTQQQTLSYYAEEEKSAVKTELKIGGGGGEGDEGNQVKRRLAAPLWFPHPKTGLYFPEGHESVMDDVPDSAAYFAETYWLRNTDNADLYSDSN